MKKIFYLFISILIINQLSAQTTVIDYSHQNRGAKAIIVNKSIRSISHDKVYYWIGEGSNSMVAVFYWCQDTQIGIAYGYRWNGNKNIGDMLSAIDSADARFTINYGNGYITNYSYQDTQYNLHIASDGSLSYTVDGVWAGGLTDALVNNSELHMEEWGNCETPNTVVPALNPNIPATTFDGIVGTDSCQAIYCTNPNILSWATGCTITRGYQDIANHSTLVNYGNEQDAIGAATESTADVVSLGDSGVAILTFSTPITNGNGYDFAVFENSLNDVFLELAFVEVSSDGINYVRFPATSNTQTTTQIGNAGDVDATKIHNLAGKYRAGWGTPFDLQDLEGSANLDLNNITHIKIVDAIGSINPQYGTRDRYGRLINDPYPTDFISGGFDLGGVAVMNGWTPGTGISDYVENTANLVFPNPCADRLTISNITNSTIRLYNAVGQLIYTDDSRNAQITLSMQQYPAGLYILHIGDRAVKVVKK